MKAELQTIFPLSCAHLPHECKHVSAENLPDYLINHPELFRSQPYLAELAAIELSIYTLSKHTVAIPETIDRIQVHPAIDLLEVSWLGLSSLFTKTPLKPVPGKAIILLFKKDNATAVQVLSPNNHELLALKIASEGIDVRTAAAEAHVSIALIDTVLYQAAQKGFILLPSTRIIRPEGFCLEELRVDELCTSPSFTLQWHVTQKCDLHCLHCYDRSDRTTMTMEQGIHVLDDLYNFCEEQHVYGQVSFTGGNPLLYPHFDILYREAAERGFLTAILGNPISQKMLDTMVQTRVPEFFQVSLEGLQEHNDYIRGKGHFDRVMSFLELLKEMKIYSMVMLTLTRANIDQVLPLAEILRDRASLFTFNRLAMVGEGSALASVEPDQYQGFLEKFMKAASNNPILSLKDNLFNLQLHQEGLPLGGGCAGFGCGAAFNFVSLLPDGEVHACRKLPSLLGNIYKDSLTEIYRSALAEQYRLGSSACAQCEIRPACGGCPAVSFGFGRNIFSDLDPYCFQATNKGAP